MDKKGLMVGRVKRGTERWKIVGIYVKKRIGRDTVGLGEVG